MDHTRKLATFCADLTYEQIPADVVEKARCCILDFIANVYGSLTLEPVKQTIAYIRSLSAGNIASVFGAGFKSGIHAAAFANGTLAEAVEAQDGYRFGGNHPVCGVIPAAFAAAEETGADGKTLITAVVAGYEAANRPAAAMHPWHTLSGFLPTGTCGTFGAAAAAAKIYGFNPETTLNAIANAGYLAPLSMAEHLMGGHTIKIVQGGQAASAGLTAAGMAGRGLSGAPQTLEGSALKGGFTQITTRAEPKFDKLSDGLGQHYSISDVYFKPYTACRHTHGAIQATLELIAEAPVPPADIADIRVLTYGIAELAVGKKISAEDSVVAAQFSIPYAVAACLMDREFGPGQLAKNRISDENLLQLARRVTVKTDDEINRRYPDQTASRVEITLADGRVLQKQIDTPWGDPRCPMTTDDLIKKTMAFGALAGAARTEAVVSAIKKLEQITDIQTLTGLI
jgi:2-methylcitrate dehydratase PrpD